MLHNSLRLHPQQLCNIPWVSKTLHVEPPLRALTYTFWETLYKEQTDSWTKKVVDDKLLNFHDILTNGRSGLDVLVPINSLMHKMATVTLAHVCWGLTIQFNQSSCIIIVISTSQLYCARTKVCPLDDLYHSGMTWHLMWPIASHIWQAIDNNLRSRLAVMHHWPISMHNIMVF